MWQVTRIIKSQQSRPLIAGHSQYKCFLRPEGKPVAKSAPKTKHIPLLDESNLDRPSSYTMLSEPCLKTKFAKIPPSTPGTRLRVYSGMLVPVEFT